MPTSASLAHLALALFPETGLVELYLGFELINFWSLRALARSVSLLPIEKIYQVRVVGKPRLEQGKIVILLLCWLAEGGTRYSGQQALINGRCVCRLDTSTRASLSLPLPFIVFRPSSSLLLPWPSEANWQVELMSSSSIWNRLFPSLWPQLDNLLFVLARTDASGYCLVLRALFSFLVVCPLFSQLLLSVVGERDENKWGKLSCL